ncbi:hypothetical protein B0H11DRAFT_1938116 [Mycena galericulata]|nr:hypothetical protein B0H11DRAFT_1938116 [Mycena galericulata]
MLLPARSRVNTPFTNSADSNVSTVPRVSASGTSPTTDKQRRSRNTPYLNGFDGERQHSLYFRNASTIAFYHYDIDSTRQWLSGLLGRASPANKGLLYAFTPCLHTIAWASTPYNNDIEITNLSIAPPRLFRRPAAHRPRTSLAPQRCAGCAVLNQGLKPTFRHIAGQKSSIWLSRVSRRRTTQYFANERAPWSVLGDKIPQVCASTLKQVFHLNTRLMGGKDTTLAPLLQLKSPKLALTYLTHELCTPSCTDEQWEQHFEDIYNISSTTELLEPLTHRAVRHRSSIDSEFANELTTWKDSTTRSRDH